MNARAGAEGIAAKNRVLVGQRNVYRVGHETNVLRQGGEVIIDPLHQFQIDHQQVDGRVADALANTGRGSMNAVGTRFDGGDGVDHPQSAVAVSMPVDLHLGIDAIDDAAYESDQV